MGTTYRKASIFKILCHWSLRILKLLGYAAASPVILGMAIFFMGWFSLMYWVRRYDEYGDPTGIDMTGFYVLWGLIITDVTFFGLVIA